MKDATASDRVSGDLKIITDTEAGVARVLVANPPVNALTTGVVGQLTEALGAALRDAAVRYVTVEGTGCRFSAGADIADLDLPHFLFEQTRRLLQLIDEAPKPVIALIAGVALGSGLELALACHARIATKGAMLGLPEITLGLLPCGGGTQRLPRLIGAKAALDMMLTGKSISGAQAHLIGLVDEAVDDATLLRSAAEQMIAAGLPTRKAAPNRGDVEAAARGHAQLVTGSNAAASIVKCVEAAVRSIPDEGLKLEAKLYAELTSSRESRALRHAFLSERAAARLPGLENVESRRIRSIGVVGAGTMGSGIAAAALAAGFEVTLTDSDPVAAQRARQGIAEIFARDVAKSRIDDHQASERMTRLSLGDGLAAVADADLVIEAVFEDMEVKQRVLAELDGAIKEDCVLASNTSTLDLDALAGATRRPERVIGLHFFSPAHVMRLIEVVRGKETAPDIVATALMVARRMRKVPVVSGVCDGFIGNRMFEECLRQAYFLLEEGALPHEVDGALERFGMAMGPLRVMDLAGQDIGYQIRQRRMAEHPDRPYSRLPDLLCEQGRLGQKTKAGFYDYPDGRKPVRSNAVEDMVRAVSSNRGRARREISDDEIVERCIFALVNEGAKIVEEGIAARPLDVDVVWLNGYGFPRERGGPMFHADEVGLPYVLMQIKRFESGPEGWAWKPAALLERLAKQERAFGDLLEGDRAS